jgi:two-component system response regulator AtoC
LSQPNGLPPELVLFGQTIQMAQVQEQLRRSAAIRIPVLIEGESGTGKELIAQFIAALTPNAPLVKVSCPAIPGALLESELFGYEKGAFTGAYTTRRGRVDFADKGTLFLDEISEISIELQAKLVHLLQDGHYSRLGGHEQRKVDVRLISATNHHLKDQVAQGLFREDLFYRINALTFRLPSLRDRIADLPMLVEYFLNQYSIGSGSGIKPLSRDTLTIMQHYHWPGNIRELENCIRRYVLFQDEESIASEIVQSVEQRFEARIDIDTRMPLKQLTKHAVQDLERQVIMKMLQMNNWNRKKTADALEISYRGLLYKMRDAGFPRKTSAKGHNERTYARDVN